MTDTLMTVVFLILGFGMLYIAFKAKEKRKRVLDNGVETEGVINGFEISFTNDGSVRYPIIKFSTKEGKLFNEVSDYAPLPFTVKNGKKVKVIYNAGNPKEFIFKTSIDFSKLSYLFIFLGIVCLGAGLWFAYKILIS